MPFPLIESPVSSRSTVLTAAIRRQILSALAASDCITVPSATAQIAAGWSARRRRRGDSPAAVRTAAEIVFQVGAEIADEMAAPATAPRGAAAGAELFGSRRTLVPHARGTA